MEQKNRRTDVTSKVYGKMDGGHMSLYMDKENIGRIRFTNQGNEYEMAEGFEFDSEKIYRREYDEPGTAADHYVDGCDGGWC